MNLPRRIGSFALASSLFTSAVSAQTVFGPFCAGGSGAIPRLTVASRVEAGQNWTLQIQANGGIGLGYLLIGFSNTTASTFGGLPLPIDLGALFGDPLWSGCSLNVDPSYTIRPYTFDPLAFAGLTEMTFPGWDDGTIYMQAVNVDADFVTRIAGVSQGVAIRRTVPIMVPIAAGTFEMGSNNPGPQAVHTVTISQPFWMGRYEVTQSEYAAMLLTAPSNFQGADLPVEKVTWNDARAYCAALTAYESLAGNVPLGYEYRLPTEAEWEYACRAGTTTEYGVGDGVNLGCSDLRWGWGCGSNSPVPVGSYAPNAWGLHDMHGNVYELCLDSYLLHVSGYLPDAVTDPFVSGGDFRVTRGGGWPSDYFECRSAFRGGLQATSSWHHIGFRVVLAPIIAL